MRRLAGFACAVVLGALLPAMASGGESREWKNPDGNRIKLYDRSGTRLLRVSFDVHDLFRSNAFDRALAESLKAIAEVARDQSSEIFAVTNMYCSRPMIGQQIVDGCAMEGAWLKPGEKIATAPKDNLPVYFSTQAAIAQRIRADWYTSLNTRDGLTGKVNIVPSGGALGAPVLGADPGAAATPR